ncbi:MAG TPA: hypothetical protein VFB32_18190 [Rudaea sp.]|nr:hypothetical protein [Rudaea sp.]
MKTYAIKLVDRGEGVEYEDDAGAFHFNVEFSGGEWIVYLPCTKGEHFSPHELTEAETERILPKLENFLRRRGWRAMFGRRYPVRFEREVVSPELVERRQRAQEYWRRESHGSSSK